MRVPGADLPKQVSFPFCQSDVSLTRQLEIILGAFKGFKVRVYYQGVNPDKTFYVEGRLEDFNVVQRMSGIPASYKGPNFLSIEMNFKNESTNSEGLVNPLRLIQAERPLALTTLNFFGLNSGVFTGIEALEASDQ